MSLAILMILGLASLSENAMAAVVAGIEVYLVLAGLIDVERKETQS